MQIKVYKEELKLGVGLGDVAKTFNAEDFEYDLEDDYLAVGVPLQRLPDALFIIDTYTPINHK